jgi:hypothetical protein
MIERLAVEDAGAAFGEVGQDDDGRTPTERSAGDHRSHLLELTEMDLLRARAGAIAAGADELAYFITMAVLAARLASRTLQPAA